MSRTRLQQGRWESQVGFFPLFVLALPVVTGPPAGETVVRATVAAAAPAIGRGPSPLARPVAEGC